MTGPDLKALRELTGHSQIEFGRLMGYVSKRNTLSRRIRRLERMAEVPGTVAERARAAAGLTIQTADEQKT